MFLLLIGPRNERGLHHGYLLTRRALAGFQVDFPNPVERLEKLFDCLSPVGCGTGEALLMSPSQWRRIAQTVNAEVHGPGELAALSGLRGEGIGYV